MGVQIPQGASIQGSCPTLCLQALELLGRKRLAVLAAIKIGITIPRPVNQQVAQHAPAAQVKQRLQRQGQQAESGARPEKIKKDIGRSRICERQNKRCQHLQALVKIPRAESDCREESKTGLHGLWFFPGARLIPVTRSGSPARWSPSTKVTATRRGKVDRLTKQKKRPGLSRVAS